MRDMEASGAVLTAAETGHLVLATMHSNDCVRRWTESSMCTPVIGKPARAQLSVIVG